MGGDPVPLPVLRTSTLPETFYRRPTLVVAKALLGKVLVHRTRSGVAAGMIVETEAYIGEADPACHAAAGLTPRSAPLYGPPGVAYVYLNYGIHCLVNAVTEPEGSPAAVLVRALEPLEGVALMRKRRARAGRPLENRPRGDGLLDDSALCRGPGNLTRALGISRAQNWRSLLAGSLTIEDREFTPTRVSRGPRIGIRVGVERPWRFWITRHPAVSHPRSVVRSRRSRTASDPPA